MYDGAITMKLTKNRIEPVPVGSHHPPGVFPGCIRGR